MIFAASLGASLSLLATTIVHFPFYLFFLNDAHSVHAQHYHITITITINKNNHHHLLCVCFVLLCFEKKRAGENEEKKEKVKNEK